MLGNLHLQQFTLNTGFTADLLGRDCSSLLILLGREGTGLLLSDNMGNTNIEGLSSGQRHMVSQQGWLLHDGAILVAVRVGIPVPRE